MITNPTRQRALRGHRAARPAPRAANSSDHQATLAWRLTPRDRWIIRMLHEHRVLTSNQITALAFPSFRALAPLVRGDALATALGQVPGPHLGTLLAAITAARFAGEVGSADEAIALARRLT